MSITDSPTARPMVWPGSPNVRRSDPITSHEAADLNDQSRSIGLVLHILTDHAESGLADHQIEVLAAESGEKFTGQRLRTARAALVRSGRVLDSGEKVLTPHGSRTTVWKPTPTVPAAEAKRPSGSWDAAMAWTKRRDEIVNDLHDLGFEVTDLSQGFGVLKGHRLVGAFQLAADASFSGGWIEMPTATGSEYITYYPFADWLAAAEASLNKPSAAATEEKN